MGNECHPQLKKKRTSSRNWRPIQEAAKWAQEERVTGYLHWKRMCKRPGWRPIDIPAHPYAIYGKAAFDGIGGWPGFLNTNTRHGLRRKFRPIQEAAQWAQSQGVLSSKCWHARCRDMNWRPFDIPAMPSVAYGQKQWDDIGRWVGFLNQKTIPHQSKIERMLRLVLDDCFLQTNSRHKDYLTGASGKKWAVDFAAPKQMLVVEYDGQYYHRHRVDVDTRKATDLFDAAWTVVRVRGTRLKLISPDYDLIVDQNSYPQNQIRCLLEHLLKLHERNLFKLSEKSIERISHWTLNNLASFDFRGSLPLFDRYQNITDASEWAQKTGTTSSKRWAKQCLIHGWLPDGIPKSPPLVYGQELWNAIGGWGGFLGTGRKSPTPKK